MESVAERKVPYVLARYVEPFRVFEAFRVAIAGTEQEHQLLSAL